MYTQRLTTIRKHFGGLSQEEMASKLGVSRRTYSDYERGISEPGFRVLVALLDVFGVDPVWVMRGPENHPRKYVGAPHDKQIWREAAAWAVREIGARGGEVSDDEVHALALDYYNVLSDPLTRDPKYREYLEELLLGRLERG